jgi:hypothetical protein
MRESEIYNWSNPPSHILAKIYHYSHDKFKPNLRLVNKHWSASVKSEFFYSLEGVEDKHIMNIVKKYGNFVRELDSYRYESGHFEEYIQLIPLLQKFYLDLGSKPINLLTQLNTINKSIHSIELCCNSFNDLFIKDYEWDSIFQLISTIKDIEMLDFYIANTSIPSPNLLPKLPVDKFKLWTSSDTTLSFMNLYKNIKHINNLDWTVRYPETQNTLIKRSAIPAPNQLLRSSLKYLRLWVYDYSDDKGPIEPHLASELLNTFKNTYFSNLRSLEWHFWWSPNQSASKIFHEPIPTHNIKWLNLTKISLFTIDEYLMTYIVQHCVNLEEMNFNSPLVLPNHDNPMSLSPLISLKKMLFGSLDLALIDNYSLINYLFPNVVTLNLYYIEKTYEVTRDCYHIPFLFPKVNFIIFEVIEYEFDRLINEYEGILNWEELYLTIDSGNIDFINPLIERLPKLKLLYIQYHLESDDILNINRKDIKVFRVGDPSPLTYNFFIYDQIN